MIHFLEVYNPQVTEEVLQVPQEPEPIEIVEEISHI